MKNNSRIYKTPVAMLCIFAAFTGTAAATDTLDCKFEDSLLRLHVNSEGFVADGVLYHGKKEYKVENIQGVTLRWVTGLPPYQGNSLKMRTSRTGVTPSLTVDVEGTTGTITLEGAASPITCDWER